jgi:DNA-binding MarR family transcriptional regulator
VPLGSSHKNAWIGLLYAHSKLRRAVNKLLDANDCVSMEAYDVLLFLDESPVPIDMGTLATMVLFSPSGMSRLIERLENSGYVSVCRSKENHRYKLVSILPAGREAREMAWPFYRDAIATEFAAHITEDEAKAMASGFARVVGTTQLIGWQE